MTRRVHWMTGGAQVLSGLAGDALLTDRDVVPVTAVLRQSQQATGLELVEFRRTGMAGSPTVAKLLGMAAASSPAELPGVLQTASELLGGELIEVGAVDAVPTFRDVAKRWTSGDLHERYPDHVRAKDSDLDESRLCLPCGLDIHGTMLGDIPTNRFTFGHAERAMDQLPERAKRAETRRHYAQLIARVVALAVYPMSVIDRHPLPAGFKPEVGRPPAFPFLYPDEDLKLLEHVAAPRSRALGFSGT